MISIIIVNYNSSELVVNCIRSIKEKINLSYEVIVVDNCSQPGDIDNIKKNHSDVKIISNTINEGFGKANNEGVKYSEGEYILILNPDTILTEDFLTPITRYIEDNKNAGVCGPKLTYEDSRYQNSTGIKLGFLYETAEALMLIKLYRFFYNKYLFSKAGKYNPIEVSWLSAACFIIRRKVFTEIGGFNPEFFLNYEDIDLCERVRKKGYKNYYFPKLSCIHLDQQSQSRNYESFVFNRYAARLVYARNNYSFLKRLIIRVIHLSGLVLRLISTGLFYTGRERDERLSGYKKAFKLFLK